MTIWTSAALYEELRKLIPALPGNCIRCTISLGVNEIARVEVTTLADRVDVNGAPEEITQRFTLVPEVQS